MSRAIVRFSALLILLLFVTSGCHGRVENRRVADPASHRVTASGPVVGFVGEYGSHAWLGIPFAKPPTGTLRWRAPQPPDSWTTTREALEFGPACTQFPSPIGGLRGRAGEPAGSEDCLYLNVYAPRVNEGDVPKGDQRWPVMVWIYGGANTVGSAALYNGGNLAQTEKVVVVTINYRIGPFGWFLHPALQAAGTSALDRSGNFAILDIIRSLEWVRDNAAAFGGDPGNVTIFGESAGATNVCALLLSPPARGLFHRAISESGGLTTITAAEAEHLVDDREPGRTNSSNEILLKLLMRDHRAADRAEAKAQLAAMAPADIERYLRGKTNYEILLAYKPTSASPMIELPKVFRDGTVLPLDDPIDHFARPDGYNRVPVILGTNRDEYKLFMFADPRNVRRILWVFPRLRDERLYNLRAEYLSRLWKATGADEPAAAMRTNQDKVFVYRFDWDQEPRVMGADLSVMLGAAHGTEIPFVFGHFDLGRQARALFSKGNEPGRLALSAQMMSYWAEFAYHGAPGRGRDGRQPQWLAWDGSAPTTPKFMVLDTPERGGARMTSTGSQTVASVVASVYEDPRLPTQRDKCTIIHDLMLRRPRVNSYLTAGKNGCAAYLQYTSGGP
jgi:para-nitrobenzyl esterase